MSIYRYRYVSVQYIRSVPGSCGCAWQGNCFFPCKSMTNPSKLPAGEARESPQSHLDVPSPTNIVPGGGGTLASSSPEPAQCCISSSSSRMHHIWVLLCCLLAENNSLGSLRICYLAFPLLTRAFTSLPLRPVNAEKLLESSPAPRAELPPPRGAQKAGAQSLLSPHNTAELPIPQSLEPGDPLQPTAQTQQPGATPFQGAAGSPCQDASLAQIKHAETRALTV